MARILTLIIAFVTIAGLPLYSQVLTNTALLQKVGKDAAVQEKTDFEKVLALAKEKKWPLTIKGKNNRVARLVGVDLLGYPQYTATYNNILAANTIRTSTLWAGGSTGLNLSGSSANLNGKIGLWDGGRVLSTHQELSGKINQKDNPTGVEDHSTHVAGIMVGKGINAGAKGMAYGANQLVAYDFNNHLSEMATEAPNLLISNHSYGPIAGWYYNSDQSRWEFWGESGATEDFKFGYYSSESQVWDSIAYNAPMYLIVKAAGNNRDETGPAVGQPYFRYNASGSMASAGNRPAGISSNDGYDIISGYGVSKNVLTVGATTPLSGGYFQPSDVVLSSFTSYGPTDDGRIKPDVVSDGVDLLSSIASADNAYAYLSGTSMAAPVAAGSLLLLQEQYSKTHPGVFMRAATLKGLVIHTADEVGNSDGPDYQAGWGLINMERAAKAIVANNTTDLIQEFDLANGGTNTINVVASGKGPLVVTLSWTDPKGTVDATNRLNNTAKKLINDLDIRVTSGSNTFQPWVLNPADRAAAATKGDNTIDNVEKITIPDAIPGQTYSIKITHKGTLERGHQAYSILASGVGGSAYCASAPAANAGARIDKVTFAGIDKTNAAGCTTYNLFTDQVAKVQANQTLPFTVNVSSCDATSVAKIVKIFIDFNNNFSFEAGELVATSGAISGSGSFTGNITVPAGLTIGNNAIMRVVVQETSNPADVVACGTYSRGETQDYRVEVVTPANNVGVSELVNPYSVSCALDSQMVSIKIRNFGTVPQSAIPVNVTVMNGATPVANWNAVYPGTLQANGEDVFTLQRWFPAVAGVTYTITAKTILTIDQNPANDALVSTVTVSTGAPAPTGTAEKCGPTQVTLARTNSGGLDAAYWYSSPTATTPIAVGDNATTNVITSDLKYYLALNDVKTKVGPSSKMQWPNGGYNVFDGNFVRFTTEVPLIIESAKLYIGHAGKVTVTVGHLVSETATSYQYQPVSSTVLNVFPTTPTPRDGAFEGNSATDTGSVYLLNLVVPEPGNDYIIMVKCEDGATIFRNNGITTNPYPMSIPGTISITGNSVPASSGDYKTFYYFFYDMRIALADCPSPRVAIQATNVTAPVISLNGTTLSSNVATGNQWYRDGAPIAGATNQTYSPPFSGVYKSVISTASGCQVSSNEINYVSTAVIDVIDNEIKLSVSPNPNNGQFQLQFETRTKDNLQISLVNSIGQSMFNERTPGFIGKYNKSISLSNLSIGMYILKIQHGSKVYVKKVAIGR